MRKKMQSGDERSAHYNVFRDAIHVRQIDVRLQNTARYHLNEFFKKLQIQ